MVSPAHQEVGAGGRRLEIATLLALAFFLPLYEAPKSIAWLLYLLVWAVNRQRQRDFGGRWELWDTLIAVWMASGLLVAAFAGEHGSEWHGSLDLLRYGSLLFVVRRSRYTAGEMRAVFYTLVASVLIGLVMAYWSLWRGHTLALQINSVGQVNHTAIYTAIMLGACTAWLFTRWRRTAAVIAAFLLVSLFVTASRAAIGSGLAMLLVLAAAWWPRSRKPLALAAPVVLVTVLAAVLGGAAVVLKQEERAAQHNVLAFRGGIWRMAFAAFERYPLFGVGMDNYRLITMDKVKSWRQAAGKDFDPSRYFQISHGHSLIFNTLAERGLVGAAALLAVLIAWLIFLIRHRPRGDSSDDDMLFWGASASAWLIGVGVGLANTTLHHEHAILSVLFLGLWLSRLKQQAREERAPL